MKIKYILILIIIVINSSWGQDPRTKVIDNLTFHSPDVTNLGQYGVYPVDISTGVPKIDIPLYTIKSGELELPISLSYHASGIKVEQQATSVGLGWVLNAGGVITRVLGDIPDEEYYGFIEYGKKVPDINSINDNVPVGRIGDKYKLYSDIYNIPYSKENQFQWIKSYNIDKEPDIFNINMNTLNGEFCLNNEGNFITTSHEPLKLNVNLNDKIIIVTDQKGIIYRFGKSLKNEDNFEKTRVYYNGVGQYPDYISSYFLTEIISSNYSDTIKFKYKETSFERISFNHVQGFYQDSSSNCFPSGDFLNVTKNNYYADGITKIIDKIEFKDGSLEFITIDDRVDIRSKYNKERRISNIIIYDKNKKITQKINLDNNNYFERSGVNLNPYFNMYSPNKSLKLNGIKFYNTNNEFINDYKFEYDSTPLAPLVSYSQDFWGYYNGSANEILIPKTFHINSLGNPLSTGDDRKTNFEYMKAGILKKIIYPTGGYTIYDYESNYYLPKEDRIKKSESITLTAANTTPGTIPCEHGYTLSK